MANIKSVKELVLDEQKLVTYVSVSKELCVHINESKKILESVVDEIKIKQPNAKLNVNFILSGMLNDNSARTLVCSETDLDSEKAKFKTLFFQHIYSVCQGLSGVDSAALISVNRFEDFPLCTGLIKSNSCTKRTLDEIGTLKSKSLAAVENQTSTALSKKDIKEKPKNITNGVDSIKSIVKPLATKSEPHIKSEVISPKKENCTISSSNGKINTNGKKPTKSIAGFFSKSNSAPMKSIEKSHKNKTVNEEMINETIKSEKNTEPVKEEKKNGTVGEEKKHSTASEKKKDVETEDMEVDVEEIPAKKIKQEPQSASKNTKKESSLNKIKKTPKVDKKRKRVLQISDSESEEDPFSESKPALQESDDEIPPTPTVQTIKITSGILNPKKKRKVVDKTYTDEDGYILTRKEEVYESCSEDEVEIKQPDVKIEKENEKANKVKTEISPQKEKKAKNTRKKISPPQKGKQATMMSFFKKI